MARSHLVVEDYAGVSVVTFTDTALLDSVMIEEVAKQLYRLVDDQNKQKLILDLSSVKLLSSQALGVFMMLRQKSTAIKGEVAYCGLRKDLMKVFKLMGLDKVLKFYKNDAAALKSFNVKVS